jgi:hypothetical protein
MLLARLVAGRHTYSEEKSRDAAHRPGWLSRMIAALFGRKRPA